MPLWAAAYLNMFSIRQRARSQHSRPAPVALMSEVRTCRTTEPCSNRVSWRAGPYPLISTISSASITVTVVVERTTWDWSVSYTHLRAHETRHDLVCRLLLEKKKKSNKI